MIYVGGITRFVDRDLLESNLEYQDFVIRVPIALVVNADNQITGVRYMEFKPGKGYASTSGDFVSVFDAMHIPQSVFLPDGNGNWVLRELPMTQGYASLPIWRDNESLSNPYIGVLMPAWACSDILSRSIIGKGMASTAQGMRNNIPLVLCRLKWSSAGARAPYEYPKMAFVSWQRTPGRTVDSLKLGNNALIFPGLDYNFSVYPLDSLSDTMKQLRLLINSGWNVHCNPTGEVWLRQLPSEAHIVIPRSITRADCSVPTCTDTVALEDDATDFSCTLLPRERPFSLCNVAGWNVQASIASTQALCLGGYKFNPRERALSSSRLSISSSESHKGKTKGTVINIQAQSFKGDGDLSFTATAEKCSLCLTNVRKLFLTLNAMSLMELSFLGDVPLESIRFEFSVCIYVRHACIKLNTDTDLFPTSEMVLSYIKDFFDSIKLVCYGNPDTCNRVRDAFHAAVQREMSLFKCKPTTKTWYADGKVKKLPSVRVYYGSEVCWG